jgi:hypothetical protein
MRLRALGVTMAAGMMLVCGFAAGAEIYLWTDAQGVVHMTDQWVKVPEDRRAHVSVRESPAAADPLPPSPPPEGSQTRSPQARPLPQPAPQKGPAPTVTPAPEDTSSDASSPPAAYDTRDSAWLIPRHRPFLHARPRIDPPFPYNVRLDSHDPNFVWVGPNRVPKERFTYPSVPLERQAQFQQRLRDLERQQSAPRHQQGQRSRGR